MGGVFQLYMKHFLHTKIKSNIINLPKALDKNHRMWDLEATVPKIIPIPYLILYISWSTSLGYGTSLPEFFLLIGLRANFSKIDQKLFG